MFREYVFIFCVHMTVQKKGSPFTEILKCSMLFLLLVQVSCQNLE